MESIAIIGTGIAGMACGHFLHRRCAVTFYERNDYIGGHTNTVTVTENGREIPIDTGFMVYNEVTYRHLTALFRELDVPTKNTSMSFSVQHVPSGLEFSGSGLNGLFAQRRNLLRPSYYSLLRQIHRFNTECLEVLEQEKYREYTLFRYVSEKGYGDDFLKRYAVPMSSAVWSTPPDAMLQFPAFTLVKFFQNHGFLGLNTQHQWKTVVGGSRTYRDRLIAPFRDRIHTRRAAVRVGHANGRAVVVDSQGHRAFYDRVILACHADEAFALLESPTPREQELLRPFRYQKNRATLHMDASVMPHTRRAWSSWNYRIGARPENGRTATSVIYWMNSLQHVSQTQDYFVSIDDPGWVRPEMVLRTIDYEHPVFSLEAIRAQKSLGELNASGPIYYCGSYFGYGFHEDALASAVELCRGLALQGIAA
ncbi:MAG TPA: FAD-dependent oxidoreductase [Acidobacteriota bacterium]|nr:FAD-dependent oxidoreductase [Acidobacteriota bacterium]